MFEIEEAVERVIAGPEKKSRIISEEEKRIIAYHEAGHAILSYVLPHTDPIHKMSIISRGRALGYVITLPEEDRFLKSRRELIDNITQLLGGRVSEEMNFNDITSGAQNDLDRATKITRKMITEYGMSKKLGPITFKGEEDEVFLGKEIISRPHYSEGIASAIDEEVHNIIMDCYEMARKVLLENKKNLTDLANELMRKETLSRDEILKVLSKGESPKSKRVEQLEEKSEILDNNNVTATAIKKKVVKAADKK
jgi:cell division protease FtsH